MAIQAIKVSLIGGSHLQQVLANLSVSSRSRASDLINDTAIAIQAAAVNYCPSNTGRLRQSITITFKSAGLGAEVGSILSYAAFVELGTGVKGSGSSHPPTPVGYAYGMKLGMPAQPYLFPASESQRERFKARLKEIIRPS